jgi:serine protease Do
MRLSPSALLAALLPLLFCAALPLRAKQQETVSPILWRTDYAAARQEATEKRKPVIVLFRCARLSSDLKTLEDQISRPTDPELSRLLSERVIPLRLGTLKGVDLKTFRFDYDLSLVALVLDPVSSRTLARWGSRDGVSATSRLSVSSLSHLLSAVTKDYQPDKAPKTASSPRTLNDQYPRFAASKRAQEVCYHCHYATDARYADARANTTFTQAMLFSFPLPENIGFSLETDSGNRVRAVQGGRSAAKAGIRPGDTITQANATPIFTVADLQWALDTVPDKGKVTLHLTRAGKPIQATLSLPSGWRETDISWRPSQGAIPPFVGMWETPLSPEEKTALGIPRDRLALRVTSLFAGEQWKMAQSTVQKDDVIIAVGEKSDLPAMLPRQLHTYIRLHYKVGDTLPLTVLREGKRIEVTAPCVEVSW